MKKMMQIAAFALTATLAGSAWAEMIDTGLIENGDFSADPLENGWTLSDSRVRYVWVPPADSASGRGRVTLKSYDDAGTRVFAILSQQIDNLQTNTDYAFQADHDYWGSAVRSGVPEAWLRVYDLDGNIINEYHRAGGNDWTTLEVPFNTGDQSSVRVALVGTKRDWEAESYFENAVLMGPVPEPATMGLIAAGGLMCLLRRHNGTRA